MKRAITAIRSMDRLQRSPGGCEYIVNLRPSGNVWKPVNPKTEHAILPEYYLIHHHHIFDDNKIIVINRNIADEGAEFSIDLWEISTGTPQIISNIDTVTSTSQTCNVSSMGNVLIINTNDNINYYLFRHETRQYTKLPELQSPTIERSSKETKRFLNVQGFADLKEAVSKMLEFFSEQENDLFYRGCIMVTCAFELMDGNIILHGNILCDDLEIEQWYTSDTTQENKKIQHITVGQDLVYRTQNSFVSKLSYNIDFSQEQLQAIQEYKDIIKSVNIYAHYIDNVMNFTDNEDDYRIEIVRLQANPSKIVGRNLFPPPSQASNYFFSHVVFRKIHEIPFAEIKTNNAINLNLKNFNAKEPLKADNNTHHKIISLNQPFIFNNAAHFPGTATKFGQGLDNTTKMIWDTSTNLMRTQRTSTGGRAGRGGPIDTITTHEIIQVTEITTDQGIYYAIKLINAHVVNNEILNIILEPFVSYPDRRATQIFFYHRSGELMTKRTLTPHLTLNIAYFVNKETNLETSALTVFDPVIIDLTNTQANELMQKAARPLQIVIDEIINTIIPRHEYIKRPSEQLRTIFNTLQELDNSISNLVVLMDANQSRDQEIRHQLQLNEIDQEDLRQLLQSAQGEQDRIALQEQLNRRQTEHAELTAELERLRLELNNLHQQAQLIENERAPLLHQSIELSRAEDEAHLEIDTEKKKYNIARALGVYAQPYRLQVSETDNPLVFPARHSYEINKSEKIITCTSVAEEVGTGQRGQFPLFVFSHSFIYLLQQGQGDIMYQQIIPLHRINIINVVSTERNIIFGASDGVYMMNARGQIDKISVHLNNTPEILSEFEGAIKGIDKIHFLKFIEDSIFFYDTKNDEILICNKELEYSYVFNVVHKAWYLRSDYFTDLFHIRSSRYLVSNYSLLQFAESECAEGVYVYVQSNIEYFADFSHKKIARSILRSNITARNSVSYSIFSELRGRYNKASETRIYDNVEQSDITIHRLPGSAQSFVFVFFGAVSHCSEFKLFETTYVETFAGKLR